MDKLKNLAIRLLDDENGISELAYDALLDMLSAQDALELNKQAKATDRRFYLPKEHTLASWRIPSPYEG